MRFSTHNKIIFLGSVLLIAFGLMGLLDDAKADTTTYYNQYGNTVVGNTYDNNTGTVTSTYYNQYGNTTVADTYNNTAADDTQ